MWKPIQGFEGLYEVDDEGRVKSLPKKRKHVSRINHKVTTLTLKEKILKPGKDGEGYHHYVLRKEGKAFLFKAHHLVAMAFLGYDRTMWKTKKLYVAHKDRDKTNNKLSNLEVRQQ